VPSHQTVYCPGERDAPVPTAGSCPPLLVNHARRSRSHCDPRPCWYQRLTVLTSCPDEFSTHTAMYGFFGTPEPAIA